MRAGLRAPAGAAARARAALALGAGTRARARSTLAASLHDDEREALRSSAARANAELDPRGVDYDLFEPPTSEYLREAQHATIPSVLSAPVALLHRLLHAAQYAEAQRALEQLRGLDTPLDTPLVEYLLAARWCATRGDARSAITWLTLAPPTSKVPSSALPHATQTIHWIVQRGADDATLREACIVAAQHGYVAALAHALEPLYRGAWGASPAAWPTWCGIVSEARAAGVDDAMLARLYNRVVRAQIRGGHAPCVLASRAPSSSLAAGAVFPLDRPTTALVHGAVPAADVDVALAARVAALVRKGLLREARAALLANAQRGMAPPVETLATFIAAAGRRRVLASAAAVPTGRFLRPLRRTLRRGLWDTALLRAREKDGDWRGTLRVWRRRFCPVPCVDEGVMEELLADAALPMSLTTHATAVAANSVARPALRRDLRARRPPTPYAVATVLRALATGCAFDRARLRRAYDTLVRHADGGTAAPRPSAAAFEAFIRVASVAAPRAFVAPTGDALLPTFWELLRDMQRCGVVPRTSTWTLLLQALARDASHNSWTLLCAVLRAMGGGERDAMLPAGLVLPPATLGTYTGVLQMLLRGGAREQERARQVRNLLVAHAARGAFAADEVAAYPPLRAALQAVQ